MELQFVTMKEEMLYLLTAECPICAIRQMIQLFLCFAGIHHSACSSHDISYNGFSSAPMQENPLQFALFIVGPLDVSYIMAFLSKSAPLKTEK